MLDADFYGKAAGILNLAAFVPYVLAVFGWGFTRDIRLVRLPESTKPNRATWFIWTLVGALILPAYHYSGAEETIWVPVALAAGPGLVAVLSIWRGEGGWTGFDLACLLGACVCVLGWVTTGSPVVGLLLALATDGFGAAATIRHAHRHPEEENRLAWTLFLAGDTLNLLAVSDWSWSAYPVWILPAYLALQTLPITLLVYREQPTKEDTR